MAELRQEISASDSLKRSSMDDILAVLVLYRRNLAETETFLSLGRSLDALSGTLDLFVYDNSPAAMGTGFNRGCWRVHYVHDPSNPGVSKAYNEGAKLARQLGKKWLLLLDQDTIFPVDAVGGYCKALQEQAADILAPVLRGGDMICSPCRYRFRTGFPLKGVVPGIHDLNGTAILNSGMMISTELFQLCGGFDEKIRLDFADFAFNNRLRQCRDSFFVLPFACSHGFSGGETSTVEDVARRFELFCEGAKCSIHGLADAILYRLVVIKRCIRLTLQFGTLRFIRICASFLHD